MAAVAKTAVARMRAGPGHDPSDGNTRFSLFRGSVRQLRRRDERAREQYPREMAAGRRRGERTTADFNGTGENGVGGCG